jgi:hypothetical protein
MLLYLQPINVRYEPSQRHFVSAENTGAPQHSLGPGYAMMQLGWVSDAFTLSSGGACEPLQGSLIELLQARGAE